MISKIATTIRYSNKERNRMDRSNSLGASGGGSGGGGGIPGDAGDGGVGTMEGDGMYTYQRDRETSSRLPGDVQGAVDGGGPVQGDATSQLKPINNQQQQTQQHDYCQSPGASAPPAPTLYGTAAVPAAPVQQHPIQPSFSNAQLDILSALGFPTNSQGAAAADVLAQAVAGNNTNSSNNNMMMLSDSGVASTAAARQSPETEHTSSTTSNNLTQQQQQQLAQQLFAAAAGILPQQNLLQFPLQMQQQLQHQQSQLFQQPPARVQLQPPPPQQQQQQDQRQISSTLLSGIQQLMSRISTNVSRPNMDPATYVSAAITAQQAANSQQQQQQQQQQLTFLQSLQKTLPPNYSQQATAHDATAGAASDPAVHPNDQLQQRPQQQNMNVPPTHSGSISVSPQDPSSGIGQQSGYSTIPCRARGMPSDHNSKVRKLIRVVDV